MPKYDATITIERVLTVSVEAETFTEAVREIEAFRFKTKRGTPKEHTIKTIHDIARKK